jgi:hypothetical protein
LATWSSIGTWGGEGDDEAMETASLDSESDVDPLSLFNHSSSIAKAKIIFQTNRRRRKNRIEFKVPKRFKANNELERNSGSGHENYRRKKK